MDEIETILENGTLSELLERRDPSDIAEYQNYRGEKALWIAARNRDAQNRLEIMTFLLDNGADSRYSQSDGIGVLHIMYSCLKHDFEGEAAMTNRLVDGGVDINQLAKRSGTPLEELIRATTNRAESDIDPLFRAIFSRPELDLHKESIGGETVAVRMLRAKEFRPRLAEYIRAWLSAHPE